jgi:hypothetical protein
MTIMATSVKLHPPTIEERQRLDEDLTLIEEKLQGIIVLMRDCYGKNSQAARFAPTRLAEPYNGSSGSWNECSKRRGQRTVPIEKSIRHQGRPAFRERREGQPENRKLDNEMQPSVAVTLLRVEKRAGLHLP